MAEINLKQLAYLEDARRIITEMVRCKGCKLPPGVRSWLESYPEEWITEANLLGQDKLDQLLAGGE
jgi:hypothetical protein